MPAQQLTIPGTRPRRARVACRVCEACGEALPLCACFGEMRGMR